MLTQLKKSPNQNILRKRASACACLKLLETLGPQCSYWSKVCTHQRLLCRKTFLACTSKSMGRKPKYFVIVIPLCIGFSQLIGDLSPTRFVYSVISDSQNTVSSVLLWKVFIGIKTQSQLLLLTATVASAPCFCSSASPRAPFSWALPSHPQPARGISPVSGPGKLDTQIVWAGVSASPTRLPRSQYCIIPLHSGGQYVSRPCELYSAVC